MGFKKILVLGILFILPIVVYLFFAAAKNNFAYLPILAENVGELSAFNTKESDTLSLNEHITILGFLGKKNSHQELMAFNLNEKIYKRFHGFKDFQVIFILPKGEETIVDNLREKLVRGSGVDLKHWKFAFGDENAIASLFSSLQTSEKLDLNAFSPQLFIIDKDRKLRGRESNEEKKSTSGYNALSVAELHNSMVDDVKVLLAEYRMARKQNYKGSYRDSILKKIK